MRGDNASKTKYVVFLGTRLPVERAFSVASMHSVSLDDGSGREVVCPCCGHEYQHFGQPDLIDSGDDYNAGWGGRGDLIVIPFCGECGSEWDLCFGFHKGVTATFIRVRIDCRAPQVQDPLP